MKRFPQMATTGIPSNVLSKYNPVFEHGMYKSIIYRGGTN